MAFQTRHARCTLGVDCPILTIPQHTLVSNVGHSATWHRPTCLSGLHQQTWTAELCRQLSQPAASAHQRGLAVRKAGAGCLQGSQIGCILHQQSYCCWSFLEEGIYTLHGATLAAQRMPGVRCQQCTAKWISLFPSDMTYALTSPTCNIWGP